MRAVCAGHVNWDLTLQVDRLPDPDDEARVERRVAGYGGSAANVAAGLASLGESALLLGSVGDDDRGRRVRETIAGAGVTERLVTAEGQTAAKHLVVGPGGDVLVLGEDGANEAYAAGDLPTGALDGADRLHLTGQTPETAAALADRAASAGVPVSFDPGRRLGDRSYDEVLALTDVLFLNDRESRLRDDLPVPDGTTVVVHGRDGARATGPGTDASHPGFSVDPVDTTGAGDAFAAGFLAAWDGDGADPDRALAVANACGAVAARTLGGRAPLSRAAVAEFT